MTDTYTTGQATTVKLTEETSIELIWIPEGIATVGCPDDIRKWVRTGGFIKNLFKRGPEILKKGELGRNFGDREPTEVTIKDGFWLSKYPITMEQWVAFMHPHERQYAKTKDYPQTARKCQTVDFLTALNKAIKRPDGWNFKIPTEDQWEYACRAGTKTALNNGHDLSSLSKCPNLDEVAWYTKNSKCKLQPVGQKKPNSWGLYDMHGNIDEWCERSPYLTDEVNSGIDFSLVTRGGSCTSHPADCRSVAWNGNHDEESECGIRLCLIQS